jgi:hypothetical protein
VVSPAFSLLRSAKMSSRDRVVRITRDYWGSSNQRKNEGQIAIGLLPAGLCTGDPIPPEVAGSLRVR